MKYTAFADVRERSTRATPAINRYTRTDHLQLPPKRPVQNRRKQGVEFGCRLGLQRFQLIDLGLQVVEVGDVICPFLGTVISFPRDRSTEWLS